MPVPLLFPFYLHHCYYCWDGFCPFILTPAVVPQNLRKWEPLAALWEFWAGSHVFEEPGSRPTDSWRLAAGVWHVPGHTTALPGDSAPGTGSSLGAVFLARLLAGLRCAVPGSLSQHKPFEVVNPSPGK